MPLADQAKALADLGGWAFAIFLLLVMATSIVLVVRSARGKGWVFGWVYDLAEARADKAETQTERTIEALRDQTAVLADLVKGQAAHTEAHVKLTRAIDNLRDELRRRPPNVPG